MCDIKDSKQPRQVAYGGFSTVKRQTSIVCMMAVVTLHLVSFHVRAQVANRETTNVLMVEMHGVTPNSPHLYKAIRAQLSASQLTVKQVILTQSEFDISHPLNSALRLASKHNASMVFWIQDDLNICTVYFFTTDEKNRIFTRVLNIEKSKRTSRFEIIANAVSSLLEETVITHVDNLKPPPQSRRPQPSSPLKDPAKSHYRPELLVTYLGSIFADHKVTHGVQLGLGFLPSNKIAVNAAFTQNLMLRWETAQYRLSITSRNFDLSFAGRLRRRYFEARVGLAYSASLRSISTDTLASTIFTRPNQKDVIHSLTPFFLVSWIIQKHFSIIASVSSSIALNERDYKILKDDSRTFVVAAPFSVKLIYQLGLKIQL